VKRRVLNLLTALSLLLCAAVVALWAATSETEAHVVVYVPRLGRYTLYSQYGEVRAFGVPQSPVARSLRPIVRRIRNSDLCWEAYYDVRFDKAQLRHIVPVPGFGPLRTRCCSWDASAAAVRTSSSR
jgi:hypothetical protein